MVFILAVHHAVRLLQFSTLCKSIDPPLRKKELAFLYAAAVPQRLGVAPLVALTGLQY